MPVSVDLLREVVSCGHFFDPLANMCVHCVETTEQERQQFFAKRLASGHPLVVVPPPVVVRTIELGARDCPLQPLKQVLVSHVHSNGHLRLQPVAPEMSFANQDANQETFFKVSHCPMILKARLFHCQVSRETRNLFHRGVPRGTFDRSLGKMLPLFEENQLTMRTMRRTSAETTSARRGRR